MFFESPRFPTDLSFQRPGGSTYNADVQVLESGFEQRNEFWPEARVEMQIGYGLRTLDQVQAVNEIFEVCGGMAHGFRIRNWRDYKSVRITAAGSEGESLDPISATDQVISIDSTTADIFQLINTKFFSYGYRRKTITKPVADSVLVAIQGITIPTNRWDLAYVPEARAVEGHETIGRVTLGANIQKTVNAITQASSAVVTTSAAHGLAVNDSVHFGSDVGGMTQIRGKRGLVTNIGSPTVFTVAIDSSAFTAFTTGGTINTQRQSFAFTVGVAAITKHARGLVTSSAPHNLVPGDVGVFSGISGMTELNSVEALVVSTPSATTFRIDKNTVQNSTYTSGGTFTVAERVTAGYVYDLPVRFNDNHIPMTFEAWDVAGVDLPVIELRII